ncbi:MAG: OmpA family protein [Acidobacteria bacterium]|nr:OmpA family protein [Acidobacteriota bacterium]
MALFDSVLNSVTSKFGLSSDKAGGLLALLLGMIADPAKGGFGGFIDRFKGAGLGSTANSWITTGDNEPLTEGQVEQVLGKDNIADAAAKAGAETGTATSAFASMIPHVVDTLTPDAQIPDEASLMSRIGGFLSGIGGAAAAAVAGTLGVAGAFAAGAGEKVAGAVGAASGAVGSVGGRVSDTADRFRENVDTGGASSILRWLIPLLLLGLVIALGFWFCGRGTAPTANVNVNANRTNANANRTNVNVRTNANATSNATANTAEAARTLSEVTLANGTKLQAYPGGIEDQMVKFIQSDEYKGATNETLKEKWFNFDDLNFVFGKTELTPESKRQLDNITAILKAYPDVKIKIGGYTDKKGDDAANLKLSDSRAKAVQTALKAAGVGGQVPEAEGYGEKFAKVEESASDDARKVDRKTAVRLIK